MPSVTVETLQLHAQSYKQQGEQAQTQLNSLETSYQQAKEQLTAIIRMCAGATAAIEQIITNTAAETPAPPAEDPLAQAKAEVEGRLGVVSAPPVAPGEPGTV